MSQHDLEMKSFGPFEIKNADRGEVEAVVSSLDTVDHEREVIRASAIRGGAARVKISFYGHDAIFGEAPVGKGTITVEQGKGILRGNFFMSTTRGREAFETVKALGGDGEWSIGFRVLKDSKPDDEWKAKGAERMIDEIELFEVSPVIRGASPNTATLAVKELEAPVVEPVAQADGDSGEPTNDGETYVVLPGEDPKYVGERGAVEVPVGSEEKAAAEEAERKAQEEAEAKAKLDAEAKAQKARATEAAEEFERVRRALKRMGYAA